MSVKILIAIVLFGSFALATPAGAAAVAVSEEKSTALVDYVDFGGVRLYDYAYRTLRLTNNGNTDIPDLDLSITGYGYWGRTNCGNMLPAGAQCRIELEFHPTMIGSHYGRFYIRGTEVDLMISLYGWGDQQQYP